MIGSNQSTYGYDPRHSRAVESLKERLRKFQKAGP
jgi:hypothetical protein